MLVIYSTILFNNKNSECRGNIVKSITSVISDTGSQIYNENILPNTHRKKYLPLMGIKQLL